MSRRFETIAIAPPDLPFLSETVQILQEDLRRLAISQPSIDRFTGLPRNYRGDPVYSSTYVATRLGYARFSHWAVKRRLNLLPPDFQESHMADYKLHLVKELSLGIPTIAKDLIAVRMFFRRYFLNNDIELELPLQVDERFNKKNVESKALSEKEIRIIISSFPKTDQLTYAIRLILSILYDAGARISEVLYRRVGDIHFSENGSLTYFHTLRKGNKTRDLYMSDRTAEELKDYIKRFGLSNANGPLFPSPKLLGRPLDYHTVLRQLKVVLIKLGLEKPRHGLHVPRHSCARHMLDRGACPYDLADLYSHNEDLSTTLGIYGKPSEAVVFKLFRKYHPKYDTRKSRAILRKILKAKVKP